MLCREHWFGTENLPRLDRVQSIVRALGGIQGAQRQGNCCCAPAQSRTRCQAGKGPLQQAGESQMGPEHLSSPSGEKKSKCLLPLSSPQPPSCHPGVRKSLFLPPWSFYEKTWRCSTTRAGIRAPHPPPPTAAPRSSLPRQRAAAQRQGGGGPAAGPRRLPALRGVWDGAAASLTESLPSVCPPRTVGIPTARTVPSIGGKAQQRAHNLFLLCTSVLGVPAQTPLLTR